MTSSRMLALPMLLLAGVTACTDPQAAVDKLLRKYGLQAISPVRTYITLAGFVVVPKGGSSYYLDPPDKLPAGLQTEIADFSAVLADQETKTSAGLSTAVKAMQRLIGASASFRMSTTQQVRMAQVEAAGQRLPIPAAQSYVMLPATSAETKRLLAQKGRVFIIYEVYRSANLSIEAATGQTIDVGLAVGESTKTAPANAPAANATSAAAKPAAAIAAAPAGCPSVAAADPAAAAPASASAYWIRSSSSKLSLCGEKAYPFAVRVAEVVANKTTGGLELMPGSFKFAGVLSVGTDVEKYTATIGSSGVLNLPRRAAAGR